MTIGHIGNSQPIQQNANPVGGENKIVPNQELGHVHASSKLATAGRVLLGIFTLGISEGIRALVHHFASRPAAEPRIGTTKETMPNTLMGKISAFRDIFNRAAEKCGDTTLGSKLLKTLQTNPRMVTQLNTEDLETLLSTHRAGTVSDVKNLLNHIQQNDLEQTLNSLTTVAQKASQEVANLHPDVKVGAMTCKLYALIGALKLGEAVRNLSDDFVKKLQDAVLDMQSTEVGDVNTNTKMFFDMLMEFRK